MNSTTTNESWTMNDPLKSLDPEIYDLINKEKDRQICGLEMIASENFTSLAVLECMSSVLHNKYSEGQPGVRYYGGNEFIDEIEILAQYRALAAFGLDPEEWGVNVQPYSGSPANFAVYAGIIGPHGRIMGLDLPDGGHLTHGFFTAKKKISATSIFFESMPYKVDPKTGLIDYDAMEYSANLFKPQILIAGVSCYSRNLDYARFRKVADMNKSYLMADMAHIAGLVAAKVVPSPFEYCDVVTTTVHKTLRGPRAGIIFYRKGLRDAKNNVKYDLEEKINLSVFPGLQGGPHNHAIAGIAVAMKLVQSQEFVEYQKQVVKNAKVLCEELQDLGYKISTNGTDNHLLLLDLSPIKLSGAKGEAILEQVCISVNKNTVPGDKSALNPSGIRFGTPPLTTRGMKENDMKLVVKLIHQAFKIALEIQELSGPKLVDWKKELKNNSEIRSKINKVKDEVNSFAKAFKMPGIVS